MKNARLRTRLAKAAASHRNSTQREVTATAKAMTHIQWLWNLAGCRHELAGTTPADQLPMDAEQEQANWLMQVARNGGC